MGYGSLFFNLFLFGIWNYKYRMYICYMEMTKEIKIVDTITNEEFVGTIYQERKSSYLIRFKIGLLPFSKKTGKIFGKNVQHNNYAIKMGA